MFLVEFVLPIDLCFHPSILFATGLVSGPFSSPLDPVKTSQKQRSQSASPTAALLESSFRLNAVLTGAEVASTAVQVDFCSFLIGALVKVQFDGTPSNLTGTDRSQVDTDEVVPSGDDEPARKESDALIKACYSLLSLVLEFS